MFDLDTCVFFVTNQAVKKVADKFNHRLRERGITRVKWTTLYFLGRYPGISQQQLAELLGVKSSTVVRLIDRMEGEGLLRRIRAREDRRVSNLNLTERGEQVRADLMPVGEQFSQELCAGIDEDELLTFNRVLNKFLANIDPSSANKHI